MGCLGAGSPGGLGEKMEEKLSPGRRESGQASQEEVTRNPQEEVLTNPCLPGLGHRQAVSFKKQYITFVENLDDTGATLNALHVLY